MWILGAIVPLVLVGKLTVGKLAAAALGAGGLVLVAFFICLYVAAASEDRLPRG